MDIQIKNTVVSVVAGSASIAEICALEGAARAALMAADSSVIPSAVYAELVSNIRALSLCRSAMGRNRHAENALKELKALIAKEEKIAKSAMRVRGFDETTGHQHAPACTLGYLAKLILLSIRDTVSAEKQTKIDTVLGGFGAWVKARIEFGGAKAMELSPLSRFVGMLNWYLENSTLEVDAVLKIWFGNLFDGIQLDSIYRKGTTEQESSVYEILRGILHAYVNHDGDTMPAFGRDKYRASQASIAILIGIAEKHNLHDLRQQVSDMMFETALKLVAATAKASEECSIAAKKDPKVHFTGDVNPWAAGKPTKTAVKAAVGDVTALMGGLK